MISKIKHVAIMCHNAASLCRFYEYLFALTRARSEGSPAAEDETARRFGYPVLASKRVAKPFASTVIVSDGNIGLALLRRRPGYPGGLDHFGIEVDDIDVVFNRLKEKYPAVGVVKRPSNRPFASFSSHDPEGHLFDLTQPKMENIRGVWAEAAHEQNRYIKHLTIRAINPAALAQFYVDVYEFQEEEKAPEDPNFYLTDGRVTLVLTPWKIEDYYGTEHRGPGLDHVGFKVEDVEAFKKDLDVLCKVDPEWMSPKSPNLVSEYNVVLGLLSSCRYGQHPLADPEGNLLDVSER
jgi:catechol 2,3-dioxygenase-like lactoylglutathione lyase family enzyme